MHFAYCLIIMENLAFYLKSSRIDTILVIWTTTELVFKPLLLYNLLIDILFGLSFMIQFYEINFKTIIDICISCN